MNECFWLLNHEPTASQEKELADKYNCSIKFPPAELSAIWAAIPAQEKLELDMLRPFLTWFDEMREGDIAVVQGDMSATYYIVSKLIKNKRRVFCSAAMRVSEERSSGEVVVKTNYFRHICFREYVEYFEE